MQQYNIIKTKRLILRKFNKDDTKALFTLLSDNEVNTFLPMARSDAEQNCPENG